MKRILILVLTLSLVIITPFAQTQQGYVKTKGRLASNGTVIPGSRISGATVQVKGRSAVLSQSNGTFSFPIPAQNFYLQSVQKQGYVLTDPDVLSRQYAYSNNPLVFVLETPSQQADDKLAAEKKIRRTLQLQLQEKENKIESLKEQQKLSDEEYRKQLQEIFAQQESNEKLIGEMADRYSRLDFDEVNEFNRRISQLILDGRLTEADSLLNTKGDINARIAVLRQHQEANAQAEQEINKKQKKLEKSKALTQRELEDIAQNCYSKFEIFKLKYLTDSASIYIRLRADLDSTNVDWQNETGIFVQNYLANYELARFYYLRALHAATGHTMLSMEEFLQKNPRKAENCWNNLGYLEEQIGDIDKAIMAYKMARTLWEKVLDKKNIEYVRLLTNMGVAYKKKGDYNAAKNLYYEALDSLMSYPGYYKEAITLCNNLGNLYLVNDIDKALTMFQMAQKQQEKYFCDSAELAITCYNIAICKLRQKKSKDALEYAEKANQIATKIYGRKHPFSKNIQTLLEMIKSGQDAVN